MPPPRSFLSFVRLDIRNRIFRRYPLSLPLLGPRPLLGLSNRKLTRTGLLEQEYEKHLYGDTSLFQLPERPGTAHPRDELERGMPLLLQPERVVDHAPAYRTRRSHRANSRRPGHGADGRHRLVGLPGVIPAGRTPPQRQHRGGDFGRQAYTDGGVFDNLGPVAPLPGTAAVGGELPCLPTTFSIFPPSSRPCARRASPVRTHRCAAWSDHRGGLQPAGPAVTQRGGAARWGRPPAYGRAGRAGKFALPCRRPGQTPETARVRKPGHACSR